MAAPSLLAIRAALPEEASGPDGLDGHACLHALRIRSLSTLTDGHHQSLCATVPAARPLSSSGHGPEACSFAARPVFASSTSNQSSQGLQPKTLSARQSSSLSLSANSSHRCSLVASRISDRTVDSASVRSCYGGHNDHQNNYFCKLVILGAKLITKKLVNEKFLEMASGNSENSKLFS